MIATEGYVPTVTQDGSVAGEPSLIRTAIGGSPRLRNYQTADVRWMLMIDGLGMLRTCLPCR